jgi:general secretion pathway protein E
MGVESFLLSSTIRGIMAQRLVRTICPSCKEEVTSSEQTQELKALGVESNTILYRGKGCEKCAYTGFMGRMGIFELLVVDDDMRRLILKKADEREIRETARKNGMKTLLEDGLEKIRMGVTTLSEIFRVTQED